MKITMLDAGDQICIRGEGFQEKKKKKKNWSHWLQYYGFFNRFANISQKTNLFYSLRPECAEYSLPIMLHAWLQGLLTGLTVDCLTLSVRSDPLGPWRPLGPVQSRQLLLPRVMMKMLAQASTQVLSPREPAGLWQSDHLRGDWHLTAPPTWSG